MLCGAFGRTYGDCLSDGLGRGLEGVERIVGRWVDGAGDPFVRRGICSERRHMLTRPFQMCNGRRELQLRRNTRWLLTRRIGKRVPVERRERRTLRCIRDGEVPHTGRSVGVVPNTKEPAVKAAFETAAGRVLAGLRDGVVAWDAVATSLAPRRRARCYG